jgi:hypothetical protein
MQPQQHKTSHDYLQFRDTMSGKPSNGSHGSMQRGAHKSSTKLSGVPKKEAKKSVNDYNYYLGSAKQASNYETTTAYLTNYIVKTFEYGKKYWSGTQRT